MKGVSKLYRIIYTERENIRHEAVERWEDFQLATHSGGVQFIYTINRKTIEDII